MASFILNVMYKKLWWFANLVLMAGLLVACRRDAPIYPDEVSKAGYQPLAKGSQWVYTDMNERGEESSSVITLNGNVKKINGQDWFEADYFIAGELQSEKLYFMVTGDRYTIKLFNARVGFSLDLQYLREHLDEGESWELAVDNPLISGVPAKIIGTVKEKDLSFSIAGQPFSHIIHTQVLLQQLNSGQFETWATYQFYVAPGIGIVKMKSDIDYLGVIKMNATSNIESFDIP